MSLIKKATKGPIRKPFYILFYGTPGVGKSSWAAKFPEPYFLAFEDGTNQLNVARYKPASLAETLKICDEFLTEEHPYKTLVIDSLDHAETVIWDAVVREYNAEPTNKKKVTNIADIPYGGGYGEALSKWKELGEKLNAVREKMNVILIAHSQVKQINDPSLPMPYDKHVIKLHAKAADYLKESVEAVFFAHHEVFVSKKDNERSARAFGEGKRLISTMATPSAEGKNRYTLPPTLPFEKDSCYQDFLVAVAQADPSDLIKLHERILHYLPLLKDEAVRAKAKEAFEKFKGSLPELQVIETKLKTIVETT